MAALRLALRSYREFYDQVWLMLLVSLVWWLLLLTFVFAPSATLLLFRHADPRLGSWDERLDVAASGRYLWNQFVRGWTLALVTLPVIALTAFNLWFYSGSSSVLSALGPLWLVLLIVSVVASIIAFALAATTELPVKQVIVAAARITALRLPAVIIILLVTLVIPVLLITTTLYFLLPLLLMIPGIVATAFTRFGLLALGEPIPNPNEPTAERMHEKKGA